MMVALNGRSYRVSRHDKRGPKGAPKGNVVARESPFEEFVYDIL
jgi:hypothetical protein